MRSGKRPQPAPEKKVGKKLEHLAAVWHDVHDLLVDVPDDALASYGALIDTLAVEINTLRARVPRVACWCFTHPTMAHTNAPGPRCQS